jgi:NAD(P)-dependent dehydrogenase (short-subunit alcohol dehydrogenase family)
MSLKNKVAIVTGGNDGIGYETVKGLAKEGAHVILGKEIVLNSEI